METINLQTIKRALENNEFSLKYQPKVSMVTGQICGAEALLRWVTTEGHCISPESFIPFAEETGIITDISKRVFDLLVKDLPGIIAVNSELIVSFNVSGKDFSDQTLTNYIIEHIRHRDNIVQNIGIEVTESVLLEEQKAKSNLCRLADLGVQLSMDDFGTGHSSLVELSKWPFSVVKIDKKIVNGIYLSKKTTEILQAAIRLGHQLNLTVVVEGIEDEHTYDLLQKYGCKIGQGYWISRPLNKANLLNYIRSHRPKETFPTGILYMAQLDHMQWKKTVIDSAMHIHRMHRDKSICHVQSGMPELSHLNCKLGKWYHSSGNYFGHLSEYNQINEPHEELHEIAKNLIKAANNNCSNHELKWLIMRLSKKSITIMKLLQNLDDHWVMHQHMAQYSGKIIDIDS